ncbi:MAG: hypothetical protein ACR652_22685 [Methylocystis sp.]|uniref:hypothetical protein n=1 Tax=Methylocystis sp. TaxID=1911079 RepID=UPI003DA66239
MQGVVQRQNHSLAQRRRGLVIQRIVERAGRRILSDLLVKLDLLALHFRRLPDQRARGRMSSERLRVRVIGLRRLTWRNADFRFRDAVHNAPPR